MDYWTINIFMIQILLAMGLANDHDRKAEDAGQFLTLRNSIELRSPEKINGATFYNEKILLVYSKTLLKIIHVDPADTSPTEYKFMGPDFNPRKLVNGFTEGQLLLLSPNKHCVRQLNFITRKLTTFSGNCSQPGFVDGNKNIARYNQPTDIEKSGDSFYLTDRNNDCIRKLYQNGDVINIFTIHSKPYELAGSLYVAVTGVINKVYTHFATFAQFVDDVNATVLESCSPDTLSMLTTTKCLELLPLGKDVNTHPRTIDGPFSGLVCDGNSTVAVRYVSLSEKKAVIMQLYTIDTLAATGHNVSTQSISLPATTASVSTSTESVSTSTESSRHSTTTGRVDDSSAVMSSQSSASYNITEVSHMSSTVFGDFSFTTEEIEREPPRPLSNHAHDSFDHLPKSYTENNKSWSVIVPVILAVITLLVVLIVLAVIIRKSFKEEFGSKRRQTNHVLLEFVNEEDEAEGKDSNGEDVERNGVIASGVSVVNSDQDSCLVQTNSTLSCQYYKPNSNGNGCVKSMSSNGLHFQKLNGTSVERSNDIRA